MGLCLVTGATEPYFGMAGMLAASLERHFPDAPFRLMDFGLTPAQCAFADEKGWLVRMPPGLTPEHHPFALKSELGRYLAQDADSTIVWLDCDMVAIGGNRHDLDAVIADMKANGQTIAACRDHGVRSVAEFLARFPSPELDREMASGDRRSPYLNIGIAIFRDRDFLAGWPQASKSYEASGDICFEQNAFNVWAQRNPDKFLELDARRWNVHGDLLRQIASTEEGIHCDGEPVFIVHATSPGATEHDEEVVTLAVDDHSFMAVMKWFRDERLRALQADYLRCFLRDNVTTLRKHGVMVPSVA